MNVLNLMADKESVTIPKALIRAIGLDEALLLTTLVNEYEHWKSEGKAEKGWVFPTAYDLERNLHFCWRKQWALLDRLEALDLINENLISVKTLLNSAPYIPSYEEVMKTDRKYKERIIEVFERDMNAFEETATWNYCHKLGKPLSNEELKKIDYNTFENLLIKINWKYYPTMTLKSSANSQNDDNDNPPDTP